MLFFEIVVAFLISQHLRNNVVGLSAEGDVLQATPATIVFGPSTALQTPAAVAASKNLLIQGRKVALRPLSGQLTYIAKALPSHTRSTLPTSVQGVATTIKRSPKGLQQRARDAAFNSQAYDEQQLPSSAPEYAPQMNPCVVQLPPCQPAPVHSHYPLPQCYTNKSGFMCCNKQMEMEMRNSLNQLRNSQSGAFNLCNIQKITNVMQMNLQRAFNSSFEAVTGISDFASKIHFFKDYVCKVEVDGRYMLAYGTPGQATPPSPRIVSRPPSAPQIPYQRRSPSVISKQYQVEPAGISYGRQSLM